MKNILTEALVNSATNASFIFSYTNSAKLRIYTCHIVTLVKIFPPFLSLCFKIIHLFTLYFKKFVHKLNSGVLKIKTNHLTKP